jgi:hypothetical protein
MQASFASSLDALAGWRLALDRQIVDFARLLREHDLLDDAGDDTLDAVRQRLAADKMVVAFVAEFSRGKSELVNAIFFGDTGRRILPATPGRTTMCTVELAFDPAEPPQLQLLPIESRLDGASLAELRQRAKAWQRVPLDPSSPDRLAEALNEVTRANFVDVAHARALGFWDDERPQDNPPRDAEGRVEVPAWRHALINYPHPLLKRGLVVLDTPGLNAIGAEPELTLSLLPTAHATVFVLGADTGVTRSDLDIWRDHLSAQALARYVVLNKIDTLRDPLLDAAEIDAQIEQQRQATAAMLELAPERVFPLSAREALSARVAGDAVGLAFSRLPALESALSADLLPQRRQMLEQVVLEAVGTLQAQSLRRLADRRRQAAEQVAELRGLRGKSGSKQQLMLKRVQQESDEFEQCTARLSALRAVHARMLRDALVVLSSERLRDEVSLMSHATDASLFKLGAKRAFLSLCDRLRVLLTEGRRHCEEMHEMLNASYKQLNADFGFALALSRVPKLDRYLRELDLIARNYGQYFGLSQAFRLAEPHFMEQFRRMLLSKLRVVFENASGEIELWNKSASAQIDSQLRERRRSFKRRREALERIQAAAGELEQRIGELDAQEAREQHLIARINELGCQLEQRARTGPPSAVDAPPDAAPKLDLRDPPTLTLVAARRA